MIKDRQLTTHFSLYELTRTDNADLQEKNRDITDAQILDLEELAQYLETGPRAILGPMRVHSGYRCNELNGVLPGHSTTSQHPKCEALDFDCPGEAIEVTFEKLYDAVKGRKFRFGQLILEQAARKYSTSKWIHISRVGSLNPDRVGQVMKMVAGPDGVPHYTLIERIN